MRNTKYTIDEIVKIAKLKNGELLSKTYINAHSKLRWKCNQGHIWQANLAGIVRGKWCPKCAIKKNASSKIKYDVDFCKRIAKAKKGKFLSKEYVNYNSKYEWECSKGHQFESAFSKVKLGTWCPICTGRGKNLATAKKIAKERGGVCLSSQFSGVKSKMEWKCKNNHTWEAIFDNVARGSWCPVCSSGKGEEFVRNILEQLFQKKFPKSRPEWLLSDKGIRMELDGFNESLKIAFEHQGLFHFKEIGYFGRNKHNLNKRIQLDELKKNICDQQKVKIIYIPEVGKLTKPNKVIDHIFAELKRLRIKPPITRSKFSPNINILYSNRNDKVFSIIKDYVKSKNGVLISKSYLGSQFKVKVQCKKGHIWEVTYHNLIKGRWCPVCNGNPIYDINDMKRIAKKNHGKCLSKKYINNQTHLMWECQYKHKWAATPSNVLRGTWCPTCNSGKKGKIITSSK